MFNHEQKTTVNDRYRKAVSREINLVFTELKRIIVLFKKRETFNISVTSFGSNNLIRNKNYFF